MKRIKSVRTAAVIVRMFPEERDILRFNAGLHGMSMSEYIRQTCLGIRLRKTPEEKRRLRELARIGANINQLARWANTYKRAAEAVEVLAALADIERRIAGFASRASAENEPEAQPC
ncbi:MAG: plasmid mobilization relaxosome protein MobC [Desulfovibrio sp.]|uniref:plasmid mobilization protein n=1 Tax=Desulfovibrio sp. TaxID=885 RepID=UPI001A67F38D|nr:plasmid mobilization relaxosome protein MobC [Desulfovibrio sp.]MBD5416344.1 plasmid mobilization relaxosome protein MobC [Desulfovibrio sp.]